MPNKLFISYPSESWNFAQRLAENLAVQLDDEIFIDYRSIDQADFERAILEHLRASNAVILVVTEYTFADIHRDTDWVRLEIRTALDHKIPIVLVRENGLLPPKDLPDDVRNVGRSQGIPFYREFSTPPLRS
ncbi:MAG: toll/interleukin-1 receptor domain-containing protein [Anaerolineae bacterium]|nr:toll/interleukin-1 receptor domain-containing protein [Anaerolineae bacterium]